MTKLLLRFIFLVLLAACAAFLSPDRQSRVVTPVSSGISDPDLTSLDVLKNAFENQQSNIQVKQTGRVVKLLREDDRGLKHQRFIIELASGQKILIAHNTDIAPKVEDLKEGGMIAFYGEYEWNNKGGVIHWTHHDPRGSHPNGWLLYNNRKYD